ncbi:hypothetical protein [Paratractidigestivibacter sp.]|uniref:hypothetical protein n=2 Tax=Paratractidigestivibacter sp. TaxID=2847316 RepID=UPI002AC98991|nr:hypothetical protein [Paratractidigestivibacter sp.]
MAEAGKLYEVARFAAGDDLRIMFVGEGSRGEAVLREDICGPSVVDAYDADAARLQVVINASQVYVLERALREVFGTASLEAFAADEENDILDLMDLCDREGIAYAYAFVDSGGDAGLRPA